MPASLLLYPLLRSQASQTLGLPQMAITHLSAKCERHASGSMTVGQMSVRMRRIYAPVDEVLVPSGHQVQFLSSRTGSVVAKLDWRRSDHADGETSE
jgi:hypothetical protein